MIKSNLFNSNIHRVLAKMGHTDQIAIADAGLPIPESVERIDIALMKNLPSFLATLETVLPVMQVERVFLAEEIKTENEVVHQAVLELIERFSTEEKPIEVFYRSHVEFKQLTAQPACKAIVRTGECTPFANIILESGVVF